MGLFGTGWWSEQDLHPAPVSLGKSILPSKPDKEAKKSAKTAAKHVRKLFTSDTRAAFKEPTVTMKPE
jgi:hypothetical protein